MLIKEYKIKNRFILFSKNLKNIITKYIISKVRKLFLSFQKKYKNKLSKKKISKKVIFLTSIFLIFITYGSYNFGKRVFNKVYYKFGLNEQVSKFKERVTIKPEIRKALPIIPRNYLKGLLAKTNVLEINISNKNLRLLKKYRDRALKKGAFFKEKTDYINAKIVFNDKIHPVQMRLKGDLLDHLQGNKWSYRLKILGDNSILGMKKFSLQSPKVRNYLGEPIFHKLLEYENIPNLRYELVKLKINGKDFGIYSIEEHFDKFLIENNRMREGIVVGLNENDYWKETLKEYSKIFGWDVDQAYDREYKVFDSKRVLSNPNLQSQANYAISLLKGFLDGDLKSSEVFDVDLIARYFAIIDLAGASHAYSWNNLRFIFNPLNQRLTPVGFDGDAGNRTRNLSLNASQLEKFFKDKEFLKEYIKNLERISNKEYLDNFFEINKNIFINFQDQMYLSYPWIDSIDNYFDLIKWNQGFIKDRLNLTNPITIKILEKNNLIDKIQLSNRASFPLVVNSIFYNKKLIYKPKEKIVLPPRSFLKTPIYKNFNLNINQNNKIQDNSKFEISYNIIGSKNLKKLKVAQVDYSINKINSNKLFLNEPNSQDFDFLIHDYKNKIIYIKEGSWNLDEPLIIPKDFLVTSKGHFKLNLINDGVILSRSPLNFLGEKNKYIEITANNSGMGIIVLNAIKESKFKYIKFKGLSVPFKSDITGSLTFFKSPLSMEDCEVIDSRSEDALNVFRSDFFIKNSSFIGSKSDALDIDFGLGIIDNVIFKNIANDAIDISGTELSMNNVSISDVNDKAISIGEKSNLFAQNIFINNVAIGIASKDLSKAKIDNIEMTATQLGFAIFKKKYEYGPASLEIKTKNNSNNDRKVSDYLKFINTKKLYLLESPSTLSINNFSFKPNSKKVKDLLYGVVYGEKTFR